MIKNIFKIMILSFLFGVAIFTSQNNISLSKAFIKEVAQPLFTQNQIETISLADTIMLNQNNMNTFLDVRAKRYYDYSHIPGAINIPYDQLDTIPDDIIKKLNASPNIVLYCISTSCGVSYSATRILIERGVKNIKVYSGGWGEWKSCKLPVISYQLSVTSDQLSENSNAVKKRIENWQ